MKLHAEKTCITIALIFLHLCALPNAANASIDAQIDAYAQPAADLMSSIVFYSVTVAGTKIPLIVCWLILGACFFTIYLGFINFRGFGHAVSLVFGKHSNPQDTGEISHFRALTTAISGTVGIGNIAGVAISVSLGGPGALFWLFVAGLMGMTTKFVECSLGVKYRVINPDGSVSGGPMYYLRDGLAGKGRKRLGKVLGLIYAVSLVVGCLGSGNMFQSNQAYAQILFVTGGEESLLTERGWLVGLIMAICVGLFVIGGIKSIARATSKLVPFMVLLYVVGALTIIAINFTALPGALAAIVAGAFSMQGVTGGVLGVMIIGFQRAAFSNEAGIGSAAVAHSAVRTKKPMTEGFVALLEPFVDTVVICTLTGLVLVTSLPTEALTTDGLSGIELTSSAFESKISWSPVPLSLAAILFAFSTLLAWAYYGMKAWTYLFGAGRSKALFFNFIFCVFIVIGASVELDAILGFSDAMVFVMSVPNIIGLYILAPEVKRDLAAYLSSLNPKTQNEL